MTPAESPWPASALERLTTRSVDGHRAVIRSLMPRLEPRLVPLADAAGRVLATDVVAPVDVPGFACSSMDGYAVRARDVGPAFLRVTDDIPAGRSDLPTLAPGCAHRIMTGAALPHGADAVVEVEETSRTGELVEIHRPVASGRHVRRQGEDVLAGTTVLTAGTLLGPMQLALLAALGLAQVSVRPAVRVLVVSAGSELIAPGTATRTAATYESNSVMIATALQGAGAQAEVLTGVPDDAEALQAAIRARLHAVDLVVTTGGVSAGAYEVVKDAFADSAVAFGGIAMRPGRPQGAGRFDGVAVVAFPGTPVAALTSYEVLLRPGLREAMGFAETERRRVAARLTAQVTSRSGVRQYVLGRLDAVQGSVEPMTGHGGHHLHSLALATCLIEVAEDTTDLPAGTIVETWQLT